MKKQSYQKVIDKDIIEVKQYLLDISEGYWMQDIHDLINISMDVKIIRKKLMRRKDLELAVFSKIKKLMRECAANCFHCAIDHKHGRANNE